MAEADGANKKKNKNKNKPSDLQSSCEREGKNLLGSPSYTELSNGRFKCVETGHELPAGEMESYGQSKRCRLGMIEFAMKNKKPPLNMFKRDPNNSSKLICKLTGDIVNKLEEHIWKHLNGKRFLNKLELKEMGKLVPNGEKGTGNGDEKLAEKENEEGDDKKKRKNKKKDKKKKKKMKEKKRKLREVEGEVSEAAEMSTEDIETEEIGFWVPPVGSRWDNDEGGDRWGSDSESGDDTPPGKVDGNVDDEVEDGDEVIAHTELSRAKRALDDNETNYNNSLMKKKKKKMKKDDEPTH